MNWLGKILKALVLLYAIFCIGLFFVQEKIFFKPHKLDASHQFRKGIELKIPTADGKELSCLKMHSKPNKGAILYLHGNKGSIRRCINQTGNFQNLGYDIFLPDYRGFGKSTGKLRSEKQMNADMEAVLNKMLESYKVEDIIIIGYSMGTGMASYLAVKYKVKALFMIAPFKSLVAMKNKYFPVVPSLIMKYKFRTDRNLVKVDCPVFILHGSNDELIPIDHSRALKEAYPEKVEFHTLEGDSHRGSIFDNEIRTVLTKFLSGS